MTDEATHAIDETPARTPRPEQVKTQRHIHRMGHEEWVTQRLRAQGRLDELPVGPAEGVAVQARVDWGRWLVDCPFCTGAELVDLEDLRFFCTDCGNKGTPGLWVQVIVPGEEERIGIEKALLERPAQYRHWKPGETLMDVQTANILHANW